jgi:IclR family transcriptional regulator, KDG regulon repressor
MEGSQMLARALGILDVFSAERTEITLGDLARETGLNKATLLRYLEVLRAARLVERDGAVYHLGLGAFDLGANYLARLDLHKISRRRMEALAESCSETVSLAILDQGEVVYIEVVRGQAEIGIQSRIGARQPAHCTSLGKVLLAWTPAEDRERWLYSRPLVQLTPNTIGDRETLERHLETVRAQGFAYDEEERAIGIRCVAAPIHDHNGDVVASMSISGAAFRMVGAHLEESRVAVVDGAAAISEELGWREPAAASAG